jgi:hypothetical protein
MDLQRAFDEGFDAVKKYIDDIADHIEERLLAVEASASNVRSLTYRGTYQRAETYLKNNCLTEGGSLWIAIKDNPQGKPGASDDWQLAAKRGADGKDAK